MPIYNTAELNDFTMKNLSPDQASWIYNGLDCCVTHEVYGKLTYLLENEPENVRLTYQFSLDKQAPIMEMSMRGLLVDQPARFRALSIFEDEQARLKKSFDYLCMKVFDQTINPQSPPQLLKLFYTFLGMRPVRKRNARGEMTPTVNREALEKFRGNLYAQVFSNFVLNFRDLGKKISFLRTQIDPDGRMRTSYNIAGTNTGRLAASMNEFGTGTNSQNIDTTLRFPFIASPKKILINVDLEQADARNVGARIYCQFRDEFGDEEAGRYLNACESGDLHTSVCAMAWKNLDWPSPWDMKTAKAIAQQPFYRDMSYRDAAKRLGHGTNYLGTPRTMAMHTKTEVSIIETFQHRYFGAFPLIPKWHQWVLEQLRDTGCLTTLYGRRRFFFGRWKDPATHREAVAYEPQSMTAWQIDAGYLNLWRHMPEAELLVQVHDSIQFQLELRSLDRLLPQALELLKHKIILPGDREFFVPLEAKVGWNWGDASESSPSGLVKWTGSETRIPPSYNKKCKLKDFL